MPRQTQLTDAALLQAALDGLEIQRQRIDDHIAEIRSRLGKKGPGRPKKATGTPTPAPTKKRTLSAAGRKRIAAAQRKRWAEAKKAQETESPEEAAKPAKKKRTVSTAARKRMAAAQKRRWAKAKKPQKKTSG